ncbi:MAG: hypothetical protein HYT16_01770 [DPANN group archaeon]|nr:hypothetical protein [DPANN group archaeon]
MAISEVTKKRYATFLILALITATAGTAVYISQKNEGTQFFKKDIIYGPSQQIGAKPQQQQTSESGYATPTQTQSGGGSSQQDQGTGQSQGQGQQGGGQPLPPPQQAQCTDSDNGLNKNMQGNCIDASGARTDACQGNALIEFQCVSNACQQNLLFCPQGTACVNGACVLPKEVCPVQAPNCLTAQDAAVKGCAQQSNGCGFEGGTPKFCWACQADKCQAGQTICGGFCTNIQNDANNCGACNSKCNYLPENGGKIMCTNGECDFTCQAGYQKETNLQSPFYNTCVKKESTFCIDSDLGKDTHRQGTCTEDYFSYADKCGTNNIVEEYLCINNQCSSEPIFCAANERCEGGRCISKCTDTDGGYILGTQGTCTALAGTFTDTCAQSQTSNSILFEYSCSDAGACLETQSSCPQGQFCDSGACRPIPPPPAGGGGLVQFCTDTDNGIDTSTEGSCSSGGNNYYDTCFSTSSVAEYFCSGSACTFNIIQCPQGQQCNNNKCEQIPIQQYPYPF